MRGGEHRRVGMRGGGWGMREWEHKKVGDEGRGT